MKSWLLAACLGLVAGAPQAAEIWQFGARIAVTAPPQAGIFHHLDGAGRKHLAVASNSVAAAWEDNRSGDPQIYVAVKPLSGQNFTAALQVSDGSEAYEPAIAALPDNRFLLAWEQDTAIHARLLDSAGPGPALKLADANASHASLAVSADGLFAAWREQRDRQWFVKVAALRADDGNRLVLQSITPVEKTGLQTQVLFPTLTANEGGICVAWEDRRAGHTRLLVSYSIDSAGSFAEPQHLNEFLSGRNQYDQGNGVTRVSLASFAGDEILAAWMDKRRGGLGYGIFAALGSDAGEIFGPNEKVHGDDGDEQPHYNPTTAGNERGDFVVAWDDFRRGDSDIWLSSYNDDDEWGEDHAPAPAAGSGEQSHPALALDENGGLHLLWMERTEPDAPSRLWYSHAPAKTAP